MKKIFISIFFIFITMNLFSQNKNIYVGDILSLEIISNGDYTIEEIKSKFKDFEIVKMDKGNGKINLDIRTFETGTKEIRIGNSIITIEVKSILEDEKYNSRDDIYNISEQDITVYNITTPFPLSKFIYIFIIFIILILIYLIYFLYKKITRKTINKDNSLSIFIKDIDKIDINCLDFYVQLTFLFKNYIYNEFNVLIIGNTSKEIIYKLLTIELINKNKIILEELTKWFEYVDLCKYSNYSSKNIEKIEKKDELKKIVLTIYEINNNTINKVNNLDKGK
ncbi:MAG: hypothetical protein GX287_02690 [Fusobacteria bacterium]|nr:hypothetical protein [Fusobacteriota bacterium]